MKEVDFFTPKIWDFAYPTGQAPPLPAKPPALLKYPDAPKPALLTSETSFLSFVMRQESSSSSSSSSFNSSNSESSTPPSTPPGPFTPSPPPPTGTYPQLDPASVPAWAKTLPQEHVRKDGIGNLLRLTGLKSKRGDSEGAQFGGCSGSTIGMGRGMARGRMGGIQRPGHPVLKLSEEERDRV